MWSWSFQQLFLLICIYLQLAKSIETGHHHRPTLLRHEISSDGLVQQMPNVQPQREDPERQHCSDCCNDGQKNVACADVEACAATMAAGRYALVFSFVGKMGLEAVPFLESAKAAANLANKADILILMTQRDAQDINLSAHKLFQKEGVQVHVVEWALPPRMKYTKRENWCGEKDLIRLHALGLDDYDAVAYFDNDIEFQGDILPILRCASAGNFLTTNGGLGEALNVGFFALKPHRLLLKAAEDFAQEADYSELTGWAKEGWKPCGGYYVGGECGQGFFHTLFYKRQRILQQKMLEAGQNWTALQIDKCVWNYQTSFQCPKSFHCSNVRVHHKPMKPGSDPHECLKSKYSKVARTSYLADARSARSAALAQGVLPVRRFGFYFPVHDQVQGVVEVLKSARHFYPEAPIYMLQDGGSIDFGPLCRMQRFNCIFQRAPGENSRWNPHSWFARMRDATEILRSEYVIYLEPDVKITRRHHIDPKHDAGGVYDNFNPRMSAETKDYLEGLGRERDPCFSISWTHFGLCGGSYFRSEAILDAFKPQNILRIDWQRLSAKEGDKTMSSDFAMLVALSARAWTVYPWEETAQHFNDAPSDPADLLSFRKQWPACNESAAFQHNHKELYHATIADDERAAIAHFTDHVLDTTCHGCVWYKDGSPRSVLSIPSRPPDAEGVNLNLARPSHCDGPRHVGSLLADPGYIRNAGSVELPFAGSAGLPLAEHQPPWLLKKDVLVEDGRDKDGGGILVVQPVFMEAGPLWGTLQSRPRWLRSILATNRFHVRRYGHAMVIRWLPSQPQLLEWQRQQCGELSEKDCTQKNERENFNWEKHRMLEDYLKSSQNFSYVMMLDADAALVRHEHDILAAMADQLTTHHRDVFLTNEDWLANGAKRINGGVIFAKNSQWSKDLFQDTTEAHVLGPRGLKSWRIGIQNHQCSSNEQICLNDAMAASSDMGAHALLAMLCSEWEGSTRVESNTIAVPAPYTIVESRSQTTTH